MREEKKRRGAWNESSKTEGRRSAKQQNQQKIIKKEE